MENNENMNNNENMENDEYMDNYEDVENNEDVQYNESTTSNGRKRKNKNNKKKIIAGVIVALVAIGLISGFLLYMNNMQNDERSKLVSEIHKNNLTKENADYLQNKKYINQDQLNQLKSIDEKANDSKETLDQIKNLLKDQSGILNPINKKLGDSDSSFTKSLNYFLGLIPGLGSAISNIINVNDIKNIVSQKFDLQKIVNENTPIIKKKDEALAMISKIAYDKNALLKGNFSSIAGTYVNNEGKEIVVGKDGVVKSNKGACKSSKPKLNKDGFYSWSIGCSNGKNVGFFFPIGVPVTVPVDGGKTKVVQTDVTKNRIAFGQQLSGDAKNYYARK